MRSMPLQLCYDTAMKFVTMRELRNQTTRVIEELAGETGVITSNGKPVGVLLRADEDFDELLRVVRQARAAAAVSRLRLAARESGVRDLTPDETEREIQRAREA